MCPMVGCKDQSWLLHLSISCPANIPPQKRLQINSSESLSVNTLRISLTIWYCHLLSVLNQPCYLLYRSFRLLHFHHGSYVLIVQKPHLHLPRHPVLKPSYSHLSYRSIQNLPACQAAHWGWEKTHWRQSHHQDQFDANSGTSVTPCSCSTNTSST